MLYHQDPLCGVVRGREKNGAAWVDVFLCVGVMWVYVSS